jgi:threonine/homoserine/homoserine lactone efflux protein
MTYELFTALIAFAFASSITPGPNNLMLMASGANFGFKRTTPNMLGVGLEFVLMLILVGIGLIQLFDAYPLSHQILKVFSICYLVYLAFKIATSSPPDDKTDSCSSPMTFMQAVQFQWVNPKAWTMVLTVVSVYSPSRSIYSILLVGLIFGAINLPSVSVWTVLGQQFRKILTNPSRFRLFNVTMSL